MMLLSVLVFINERRLLQSFRTGRSFMGTKLLGVSAESFLQRVVKRLLLATSRWLRKRIKLRGASKLLDGAGRGLHRCCCTRRPEFRSTFKSSRQHGIASRREGYNPRSPQHAYEDEPAFHTQEAHESGLNRRSLNERNPSRHNNDGSGDSRCQ